MVEECSSSDVTGVVLCADMNEYKYPLSRLLLAGRESRVVMLADIGGEARDATSSQQGLWMTHHVGLGIDGRLRNEPRIVNQVRASSSRKLAIRFLLRNLTIMDYSILSMITIGGPSAT